MIQFKRVTGAAGADVFGIDLTRPLDADQVKTIKQGLLEHLVLFFREQEIMSFDQHMALAKKFGEPEPTPFRRTDVNAPDDLLILDQTKGADRDVSVFHADNTFRIDPPMGAILQAHQVPEYGGDTCFSSMYAAFDALSPRMKAYLDGLEASHSYAQMVERLARNGGLRPSANSNDHPPVKHPVVARHPETGRKLLYVNASWTTHIDGVPADEGGVILRYLFEHIKRPEFQVRMRWNKGDVTFWDNRSVQHYAVPDYNVRRLIHRISFFARAESERFAVAV